MRFLHELQLLWGEAAQLGDFGQRIVVLERLQLRVLNLS